MPHDFSLWQRTEVFSPEQQEKILALKSNLWNAAAADRLPAGVFAESSCARQLV
ncbi:MAG: hypothetical protein WA322_26910 [Pseudolabrys sp.]|jgi:hypothetical protein